MDGILNVLKPAGMTSFDVVGFLRGVTKIRKIGHTGTLDPGAVGVLPICIGNATKTIEYLTEKDKLYRAEMTLGSETDTQDSTGTVTASYPVEVSDQQIFEAVNGFVGKYGQIPPMYSAIKQDGKKLYDLARSGITVERKPREVEIYAVRVLHISESKGAEGSGIKKILFDIHCSKGTYIRTLCHDIGQRLGCGGHMSFLVRMKTGIFDLASALTVEEIKMLASENTLMEKLISVKDIFQSYKKVVLNQIQAQKLRNGLSVIPDPGDFVDGEMVSVFDPKGEFFSLSEVTICGAEVRIKSKKQF